GIASAWARGLSIDCGCFGKGGTIAASQTQYPQEIARDVGLLACAVWLAVRPRSTLSLDGLLSPSVPARTTSTSRSTR
ncbi:MAG TPA: MauE/DoxX family redox-associated membrane protein, partial [Pedococcus sp.]|nr:MauE/DoxX family redox-associated membrane protein [Pedococcus sp.]